ncbi:MAG: tyrosine-type recombinase/integrase, partial [Chloroflexota bacterium]
VPQAVRTRIDEHRKMRTLPLDRATSKMLREYLKRGGPIAVNGKMVLFGITRFHAWRIIKDLASKAGLPRLINQDTGRVHWVSPHRLRDAFAVHAVKHNDTGDGLRILQTHLGHSSFDTTARYRKVSGGELEKWYDNLWSPPAETEMSKDDADQTT